MNHIVVFEGRESGNLIFFLNLLRKYYYLTTELALNWFPGKRYFSQAQQKRHTIELPTQQNANRSNSIKLPQVVFAVEWSNWIGFFFLRLRMQSISHRCRFIWFAKNLFVSFVHCAISFSDLLRSYTIWKQLKLRCFKSKREGLVSPCVCVCELNIIVSIDYVFYGVYCWRFSIFLPCTKHNFANFLCSIHLVQVLRWVFFFFFFLFIHSFCSLLMCHLQKKNGD